MTLNSRAGLRSRPANSSSGARSATVRDGRPLQTRTGDRPRPRQKGDTRSVVARPATPIGVALSPSTSTRRGPAAARAPFVVLVLALAIGGLIGLVLLNTTVNENAFRLHDLDTRQQTLDKEEQRLEQARDDRESPQKLADRAKAMGLVPAGDPGFVVLPDGRVVGTPVPAQAPSSSAAWPSGRQASGTPSPSQRTPSATVGPR